MDLQKQVKILLGAPMNQFLRFSLEWSDRGKKFCRGGNELVFGSDSLIIAKFI